MKSFNRRMVPSRGPQVITACAKHSAGFPQQVFIVRRLLQCKIEQAVRRGVVDIRTPCHGERAVHHASLETFAFEHHPRIEVGVSIQPKAFEKWATVQRDRIVVSPIGHTRLERCHIDDHIRETHVVRPPRRERAFGKMLSDQKQTLPQRIARTRGVCFRPKAREDVVATSKCTGPCHSQIHEKCQRFWLSKQRAGTCRTRAAHLRRAQQPQIQPRIICHESVGAMPVSSVRRRE